MRKSHQIMDLISVLVLALVLGTAWAQQGGEGAQLARLSPAMLGGVPAVPTGDSCTGGLIFSWHAEEDGFGGTPTGCRVGSGDGVQHEHGGIGLTYETSPTPRDGSYVLHAHGADTYMTWANSSGEIGDPSAGTFDLWVYFDALATYDMILAIGDSAVSSKVCLFIQNSDEMEIRSTNGTYDEAAVTDGANLTTGNWYHIIGKWSVAKVGGNSLEISVYNASDSLLDSATSTGTIGTFTTGYVVAGDYGYSATPQFYLDKVKIYSSWQ